MSDCFLARQAIYDRQLNVTGYELLYRGAATDHAEFVDGNQATADVLVSSILDIGLEKIVGEQPAFINVTRGFLDGSLPLPELKSKIVLEILEDITPTAEVVANISHLVGSGYQIALDDFRYRPELDPLLELAHMVKLDVSDLTERELGEHTQLLRRFDVIQIAEKVETYEELETCQELGMDCFQGFFFCKPRLMTGSRVDTSTIFALELIAKLQDPLAEMEEIEGLVSCDASLAFRLLRYVNSAYFGLSCEIQSIHHAAVMAGIDTIRNWATLLVMSRLVESKPKELITAGMIRAKMCEELSVLDPDARHSRAQYYTVGLFSILDALTDQPIDVVLSQLPLPSEVKNAITKHEGVEGSILQSVIDYERSNRVDHDVRLYSDAYVKAVMWADETVGRLAL